MNLPIFSIFSISIFWNIFSNFKRFHLMNSCNNLEQCVEVLKRVRTKHFALDLGASCVIIFCSLKWAILSQDISAFLKLLCIIYFVFITGRFVSSFIKYSSSSEENSNFLDQDLIDELSIVDEVFDIKPIFLMEPIFLVILEVIFYVIILILIMGKFFNPFSI